jgi:hypothetical protein
MLLFLAFIFSVESLDCGRKNGFPIIPLAPQHPEWKDEFQDLVLFCFAGEVADRTLADAARAFHNRVT